jgi:cytochrome c nitrite reductase small subunit
MRRLLRSPRGRLSMFAVGGVAIGVLLTAVALTVIDSTDSPEFCSSCHIMDSAFGTFSSSSHAHLDCNDCHAPTESFAVKMVFKARTGMGHIYMNTIGRGEIPDVLHATSESSDVVDTNCIKCHSQTVSMVEHDAKGRCADCHRSVPHGRGMFRPDEWHQPLNIDAAR